MINKLSQLTNLPKEPLLPTEFDPCTAFHEIFDYWFWHKLTRIWSDTQGHWFVLCCFLFRKNHLRVAILEFIDNAYVHFAYEKTEANVIIDILSISSQKKKKQQLFLELVFCESTNRIRWEIINIFSYTSLHRYVGTWKILN